MMIDNLAVTIAAIRLFVLVAWLIYSLFEKDLRKLMTALVIMLIIPNVLAVITGLLGF